MRTATASYKDHHYPVVEIINHCVWLYFRFPLSFREVQELMLARGVVVSHESIRRWCAKFGQAYANGLRRRRAHPGDKRGASHKCECEGVAGASRMVSAWGACATSLWPIG